MKALFFLRHHNDVDHIAPVIFKCIKSGILDVRVISVTRSLAKMQDYRLKFLQSAGKCSFNSIASYIKEISDHSEEEELFNVCLDADIERMLDAEIGLKPGVVIFEWVTSGMGAWRDFVKRVMMAAHKRNITCVSLPHGDEPHHCRMTRSEELTYESADIYAPGAWFDYIVVPNQACYPRYSPHMPDNRIKVFGSPRYNREWLDIHTPLAPEYRPLGSEGKLKLVLFMRPFHYPIFWDELPRTIKLLTNIPGVFLTVKHHTRLVWLKPLLQKYPELAPCSKENLRIIADDVLSTSLIKWADAIIDLGTSAVFEAIQWSKPALSPEYLHATYTNISYYFPGSVLLCRDHLYETVYALRSNPGTSAYDEEEKARFIREMIHVPDEHVLTRYADFIAGISGE